MDSWAGRLFQNDGRNRCLPCAALQGGGGGGWGGVGVEGAAGGGGGGGSNCFGLEMMLWALERVYCNVRDLLVIEPKFSLERLNIEQ